MRPTPPPLLLAAALAATGFLGACQSEQRVVRYNPFLANVPGAETRAKPVGSRFKDFKDPTALPGESTLTKNPDGSIKLIAKNVRHLMINIQMCLEYEDDEVLYEQVISEQTKQEFQGQGKDPHETVAFLKDNRDDVMALFARMPFGEQSPNIILKQPARRTMVLELTGLAAKDMRFTELWVVMEQGDWKLLWIR